MRRKKKIKRQIQSDPKYNNTLVAKFINYIMEGGKKSTAQRVVYGAFDILQKQKKEPLEVFDLAIKNSSPIMEVRSRRIGGATYQVPYEVRGERKIALSLRWLRGAARKRKGKSMAEKLAQELHDASQNQGAAVRKRQDIQRIAEANRAFAHFAW